MDCLVQTAPERQTLIRIINQITAPDSGSLFFHSEKLKPEDTHKIGYLPEERGLYKKMQVGEQALYLAQLKGLSKQDAAKRLNDGSKNLKFSPGGSEKWKNYPKECSKRFSLLSRLFTNRSF